MSIWEILLLLLVVLVIFGPKKLPEMGRSLGRSMREFKDSVSGLADLKEHEETPAEEVVTTATASSAADAPEPGSPVPPATPVATRPVLPEQP